MRVSSRYIAGAVLAAGLIATPALAGGNGGYGGGDHGGGKGGGSGCCKPMTGHSVNVPGVNVAGPSVMVSSPNVIVNGGGVIVNKGGTITNTTTLTSGGVFLRGGDSGTTIIGGGGGYFGVQAPAPSMLSGLNVEGLTETVTEQVPVTTNRAETRTRTVEDIYVIRAVCLDDRGTPHPASRPSADENVAPHFDGELFRCIAGSAMQVTIARQGEGFDGADTMMCAKGEALRHRPGGQLMCVAQEAARDCNERSLLRKYGPGIKVVRLVRTESYTVNVPQTTYQTVTKEVTRSASSSTNMVLDGGVGGVY